MTTRVADIEPDVQAITLAALWKITRTYERALDAYGGFPHLNVKQRIAIALPNGKRAMLGRFDPGRLIACAR